MTTKTAWILSRLGNCSLPAMLNGTLLWLEKVLNSTNASNGWLIIIYKELDLWEGRRMFLNIILKLNCLCLPHYKSLGEW